MATEMVTEITEAEIEMSEEIAIEITARNPKREIKAEATTKTRKRRRVEKIAMIAIDHHLSININTFS